MDSHKKHILLFAFALTLLFCMGTSVQSSIFEKKDAIHITDLHDIDDDYYAMGDQVRVDGTIRGDLSVLSNECMILGTVERSANIFVNRLHHRGLIKGSLRSFSQYTTITGRVEGSIIAGTQRFTLEQGANVGKDILVFAQEATVAGVVRGNAILYGEQIRISGTIEGNLEIHGDRIRIVSPAIITGNLTYYSKNDLKLDSSEVTILGEITHELPEEKEDEDEDSGLLASITTHIASLLAAFLFGAILIRFFVPYIEESLDQLRKRWPISLASGFVSFIVFLTIIVILFISVIAAIGGKIMISSNVAALGAILLILSTLLVPITSFATVSGGIIFYSGTIVVSLLIGYPIVRLFRHEAKRVSSGVLFCGLAIMTLLYAIPFLGFLTYIAATLTGAGAIILGIRAVRCRRAVIQEPITSVPPDSPTDSSQV